MGKATYKFDGWKRGRDTRRDASAIPPDAMAEALNVIIAADGTVKTRGGNDKFNAAEIAAGKAIDGLFAYTTSGGTAYIIVACNGNLYYSLGGSQATDFVRFDYGAGTYVTYTAGSKWSFIAYNDRAYGVNGNYPVVSTAGHGTAKILDINGTTPSDLTAATVPTAAKWLRVHMERVWAAGCSANPNHIYHTIANSATTWTGDDDNNYWYAGLNDGEKVSGFIPYREGLFIGKQHRLYELTTLQRQSSAASDMDTTLDWQMREIKGENADHGVLFHDTLQIYKGGVIYRTWDGIAWFDGRDVHILSKNNEEIAGARFSDRSEHTELYTEPSDFQAGTGGIHNQLGAGNIYNGVDPDYLTQLIYRTSDQWNNSSIGTLSATQSKACWKNNGEQYLTLDTQKETWEDFNYNANPAWTLTAGSFNIVTKNAVSACLQASDAGGITAFGSSIYRASDAHSGYYGMTIKFGAINRPHPASITTYTLSQFLTASKIGFAQVNDTGEGYYVYFASVAGAYKIVIAEKNGTTYSTVKVSTLYYSEGLDLHVQFYRNGTTVSVKVNDVLAASGTGTFNGNFTRQTIILHSAYGEWGNIWYDSTEDPGTSTFTSAAIDFGTMWTGDITAADYRPGHLSYIAYVPGGATLTWKIKTAAASAGLAAANYVTLSASNGFDIKKAFADAAITMDRWYQWQVTMASTRGFDIPRIYSVAFGANWYSAVKDMTAAPTAYGKFQAVDNLAESLVPGAIIKYYFRDDTDVDASVTDETWVEVKNQDSLQGRTPRRYHQFKVEIDYDYRVTSTTLGTWANLGGNFLDKYPKVDSLELSYFTGTEVKPSCGVVKDNRYHLAMAEGSSEANNVMYCVHEGFYQDADGFLVAPITKFTNIGANCFTEYKNRVIFGDSAYGTIWYLDSGDWDYNRIIKAEFTLMNSDMGMPQQKKTFRVVYPTFSGKTGLLINSRTDGLALKYNDVPGHNGMATFRRVLRGDNTGERCQFSIQSSADNFLVPPTYPWQSMNLGANNYWSSNKYMVICPDANSGIVVRFCKLLAEPLDILTDDFAAWFHVKPTSTTQDYKTMFGFLNTSDISQNLCNFCGVTFVKDLGGLGTDYFYPEVWNNTPAQWSPGTNTLGYNLTDNVEYFIEFRKSAYNTSIVVYSATLMVVGSMTWDFTSEITGTVDPFDSCGVFSYDNVHSSTWDFKGMAVYNPAYAQGIKDATGSIEVKDLVVDILSTSREVRGDRK